MHSFANNVLSTPPENAMPIFCSEIESLIAICNSCINSDMLSNNDYQKMLYKVLTVINEDRDQTPCSSS